MKIALLVGAFTIGALLGIDYPKAEYIIETHSNDNRWVDFDTVTITRYISIGGMNVTHSHVLKAKIECLDITFEPATIFQSCRNIKP